jgi:hypothetical protein
MEEPKIPQVGSARAKFVQELARERGIPLIENFFIVRSNQIEDEDPIVPQMFQEACDKADAKNLMARDHKKSA